jgi:predicted transcriptional regulator
LVDYLLAFALAIITASAVILGSFLSRYRQLVKEVESSTRLAKDVWDTMNSRFSVVDARIIDLMAKSEVLSSRFGLMKSASPLTSQVASRQASQHVSQLASQLASAASTTGTISSPTASQQAEVVVKSNKREGTDTEAKVLRFLVDGPRSSANIKDELKVSREHTARLMKGLFDRGLVVRNDRNKPYVYEITESGRSYVTS